MREEEETVDSMEVIKRSRPLVDKFPKFQFRITFLHYIEENKHGYDWEVTHMGSYVERYTKKKKEA